MRADPPVPRRPCAGLDRVPLTLGVIGAALLPVLAAIGAAAAIATRCTIVVERDPAVGTSPTGGAGAGGGEIERRA